MARGRDAGAAGKPTRGAERRRRDRELGNVPLRRVRSRLRQGTRRPVPRTGGAPPVRRADRGAVQAAAPDERRLSAASRLHAAHRHSLRHAQPGATEDARVNRPQIRPRLRPLHHPPEPAVPLAGAEGHPRHPRSSRSSRDARHPDLGQLHPQRHRRPFRRCQRRRDRRPTPLCRNPAPVVVAAPGIHLPAAQVQDRGDRRAARPRRHAGARHRPSLPSATPTEGWASPSSSAAASAARR